MRPPNASDFDLESPAFPHAHAPSASEIRDDEIRDDEIRDDEQSAQLAADYQLESDGLPLPGAEGDDLRLAAPESAVLTAGAPEPAHYLGLSEESDIEAPEVEIEDEEDELEVEDEPEAQLARADVEDKDGEDHAEFERVFLQWKATGDPRLRERLILMNRSMVMFLARRFMDRGELFEDVLQVGMLGLIYALDGYDMERGVKFSTFAIPTISGEIRRYFRDKVSGMRVPRGLQELHATLQTRIEELTQQLDRSPTYAEIAFSLKIEVEQVVEAMELGAAIDPLSIDDRFFGEESATIAESVGAPDPQLHAYEEHAALQAALEKLPAQERRVLEMSFFDGHSQAEIARRMNVSQMHISRLLRRSLAQLKQLLEES